MSIFLVYYERDMKKLLLLPLALLALVVPAAHAATLFTQNLAPDRNNFDGTIGMQFTVSAATSSFTGLSVTALGFQDADGDGLLSAHTVGIWNSIGTLIASASISAGTGATLDANYRYVNLVTPVLLLAGQTYTIGARVFNGGDAWTDSNEQANFTLSSYVTANADLRNGVANFSRPTTDGGGDNLRWAPANMQFTAVPEPSAALLGGLGLLALLRRRR